MRLLCTFAHKHNLDSVIYDIKRNYSVINDRIFIFENANNSNELICTYNIECNANITKFPIHRTTVIHRNGETNTMYTLNALNLIIMNMNNGVLDKNIKINWYLYPNSLILSRDNEIIITNLNLYMVLK